MNYARLPVLACLTVAFVGLALCAAEAKPTLTVLEHPSPEELQQGFQKWSKEYPDRFTFESRGVTPGGRPVLMARITDQSVPDGDKQVVLLTCCHVGRELNAATGLLRFMKWLLGDDQKAADIRRRQVVLVVPYPDPDNVAVGTLNVLRSIYESKVWSADGVVDPEKYPEAAILQGIMDEYRPELYVDFHGLHFAEQTMWEMTGISNRAVSRSFIHDVPRVINEAAEAEGFLITRGEEDMGKIRTTGRIPRFPDYLFHGRNDTVNIAIYPYSRFHTLAFIMECGFEESLIVRAKRALQVGHQRWRYERYESYPVNQVGLWTLAAISAWGTNATQRRESRCELWQKLPHLTCGVAGPYPARGGLIGYVTTTPQGRTLLRGKVTDLIERLRDDPQFDVEGLAAVVERTPMRAAIGARQRVPPVEGTAGEVEPIRHGIVIRLLIPYADAEVADVRLDGHLLEPAAGDGYHIRHYPGTVVEFAIPPDKVKDAHIASCVYDTPTKRRAGFTPDDW